MIIGGLQKNTLIDYPGKIAVTVFTIGCNFRCPFCYSSEIVLPEKIKKQPKISKNYFFNFLLKRKDVLDGVVICGGEPTIQKDIEKFIKKIKSFGLLVKIDTNGYLPEVLEGLLKENLLDYIAMDIKGPKEKYKKYSGDNVDVSKIEKSIQLIKSLPPRVDYEFRTTIAPGISKKDILDIVNWIKPAKKYFLQEFLSTKEIISPKLKEMPVLSKDEIKKIKKEISLNFDICKLR